MFNIGKETLVYVVCPAYYKTGGTELAHQLVYEINSIGRKAVITYYNWEKYSQPINEQFKKYVNKYIKISDIQDYKENILILPEIKIDLCNEMKNIQKAIWWMSVDNFVKNSSFFGAFKVDGILKATKLLIRKKVSFKTKRIDTSIVHLYQSEYAHSYLLKNGVVKCHKLSDYINDIYIEDNLLIEKKNKGILYNPKKGRKFTEKLIASDSNLKWIAIQDLTTEGVRELLKSNMIYVDFGNHPGKDRLPREAAMLGCCVITSKNGSAAFFEDIPIMDCYKFDAIDSNIDKIVETIKRCLENYYSEIEKFSEYRKIIKNEHEVFSKDVRELFT